MGGESGKETAEREFEAALTFLCDVCLLGGGHAAGQRGVMVADLSDEWGRLWFAHWGAGEVVAVDLDGKAEVMAAGPPMMGWAIDWLPDGRLVTTGRSRTVRW